MKDIALPSIEFVSQKVGLTGTQTEADAEGFVLATTLTGLVRNCLSHLAGVKTRGEFALSFARGLAGIS
jgi:hypothetical protein